jgi:quinol-cytochrome oxidoreductase complex cytochrome b subunit
MTNSENLTQQEESIPFFPDHVKTEALVVLGIIVIAVIVGLLGMVAPVGIGDPADPMNTPMHVKPEWYFLALYQLLKFVPKTIGVLIPIFLVLILALWPFINPHKETTRKPTMIRLIAVVIGLIIIIAMTIWGEFG